MGDTEAAVGAAVGARSEEGLSRALQRRGHGQRKRSALGEAAEAHLSLTVAAETAQLRGSAVLWQAGFACRAVDVHVHADVVVGPRVRQ